jgi:ankyrin repeat protein
MSKEKEEEKKAFKKAREAITKVLKSAADGDLEAFKVYSTELAAVDDSPELVVLTTTKDGNGRGALHFAALAGKVTIVDHLISLGTGNELRALVNSKDAEHETALVLASRNFGDSSFDVVKSLLEKGACVPC